MLDKSLPYFNIIMKRKPGLPIQEAKLPDGLKFVFYKEGDEHRWAEIETSVGEFSNKDEALDYFQREYMQYSEEIRKRVMFIQDSKGIYLATITGWWNYTNDRRDPSIHWLSVIPEHQGFGLSKPLVNKCLEVLMELEGEMEVYLHTQTWSYKAIGLYLKIGFELVKTGSFGSYQNDYDKAEMILKEKVKHKF